MAPCPRKDIIDPNVVAIDQARVARSARRFVWGSANADAALAGTLDVALRGILLTWEATRGGC